MAWKAALLTAALTGLLLTGCTVPSKGPARIGYSALGGVNIGLGTAVGLAMTCGIIDILQGNRRHPTKESDKFYGQCATVGLGVSAAVGVAGGVGLSRVESDEEPSVGNWALVSAPTVIIAGLGAIALLFPDKEKVDSESAYLPVSGEGEPEEEERGFVADCTGKEIRAELGDKELVVKSLLPDTTSCDVEIIDLPDGAKAVWITERNYGNARRNSNVLLRIEGEELVFTWQGRGAAELDSEGRWWIETLECLPGKAQMIVTRRERSWDGAPVPASATTKTELIDLDLCLESPMAKPSR